MANINTELNDASKGIQSIRCSEWIDEERTGVRDQWAYSKRTDIFPGLREMDIAGIIPAIQETDPMFEIVTRFGKISIEVLKRS